jgi:hypothetical protein
MGLTFIFQSEKFAKDDIFSLIKNFDNGDGKLIGDGNRNQVKYFRLNGAMINIKSFKIPATINRTIYQYFRKSKARRSFEHAQVLLKKGIRTPAPIAFYEEYSGSGLTRSFYITEHLENAPTFYDLITLSDSPDENILRQFTHFSYQLHEKGIDFLDHSRGNTLIKRTSDGKYNFYLVDLNRMRFRSSLNLDRRMKNLQRLTIDKEIIKIMSNEYAKWYNKPEEMIFDLLYHKCTTFEKSYTRRKKFTKTLKAGFRKLFLLTFLLTGCRHILCCEDINPFDFVWHNF